MPCGVCAYEAGVPTSTGALCAKHADDQAKGHEHLQARFNLAWEVVKAARAIDRVVGYSLKPKSCPHGNGANHAPYSWFCDECQGALRDALMAIEEAHSGD